eukprot:scaffold43131_cov54-Phaeocystis_antarctica.AAC.2
MCLGWALGLELGRCAAAQPAAAVQAQQLRHAEGQVMEERLVRVRVRVKVMEERLVRVRVRLSLGSGLRSGISEGEGYVAVEESHEAVAAVERLGHGGELTVARMPLAW